MASVNWMKMTTEKAIHVIGHVGRYGGQPVKYQNKDVNVDKIKDNVILYYSKNQETGEDDVLKVQMFGRFAPSVQDVRDKVITGIEEADKEHPPKRIKKDRKTVIGFSMTTPEGMAEKDEDKFFIFVYQIITKMCGGPAHVSQMIIHRDEVHQYEEHKTGELKTSKVHGHVFGLPYTEEHGINCKNFMTRERMQKLNDEIQAMCVREFGLSFNTGEKTKGVSVDELKAKNIKTQAQIQTDKEQRAKEEELKQQEARVREAQAKAASIMADAEKRLKAAEEQEAKMSKAQQIFVRATSQEQTEVR